MPVFTGTNLTCLRSDRLVFAGLSFTVKSGAALKLVGRNGSGKTSLLRLMAGLIPPWHGDLVWNDGSILEDPDLHRGRLRYVGHLDAVKPALTPIETLAFWAGLWRSEDPYQEAEAALDRLGLAAVADLPARFLSAGQRRRVNLSRLLLASAPLWLLDEPTSSLDRETIDTLTELIAEHRARAGIVVLSTHADWMVPEAETLCLDDYTGCAPAMADDPGEIADDLTSERDGDPAAASEGP